MKIALGNRRICVTGGEGLPGRHVLAGAPRRARPGDEAAERIHATPGYPFGVTVGLTFRFLGK